MKLNKLYKHRTDFTVIGLTGRTGSGCTQLANFLSKDFAKLSDGLRKAEEFTDPIFRRKFEICQTFLSFGDNWKPFDVIQYKNVLLLYIVKNLPDFNQELHELLAKFYRENKKEENQTIVESLGNKISEILEKFHDTVSEIRNIPAFDSLRSNEDLGKLHDIFFGLDFNNFSSEFFEVLEAGGYYRRTYFLHHISCNIRSSKNLLIDTNTNPDNVYTIAEVINTIIKARKRHNDTKPTKIVIDSLRNSLEVSFFKERYSAFYMIATKDVLNNAKTRLNDRLLKKIPDESLRSDVVKKMFRLDDIEYKANDFSKGIFSSPNVEHCIQKSDYHIFNLKRNQIEEFISQFEKVNDIQQSEIDKLKNTFLTREEQLAKLVALIHHPGLITPSASERNMQIATTAKLNSGCISRQVGAVITDRMFVAKSIGWNDVAKGHTPCNLRSVNDFIDKEGKAVNESIAHYSEFEKGVVSDSSNYKYKSGKPSNFKDAVVDYFGDKYSANKGDLNGANCSFCFKTIHNYYEGESNQVHTRSLHAEENAMLQLTKSGGLGVEHGILFTTASPCELCSKKAYQLGIRIIFYIDPYPGIAIDQILKGGDKRPILLPFSGATGNAYHWLYEQQLSPKDEITMSLELNDKKPEVNQFKSILKKIYPDYPNIDNIKDMNDVTLIVNEGLAQFETIEEPPKP